MPKRFGENKAKIQIEGKDLLDDPEKLVALLQDLPDLLDLAITFCKAPRHFKDDKQGLETRLEDRLLRRKWFGKKRGRIRHTFRDIERFIDNPLHTLVIKIGGTHCTNTSWAYTEDDQNLESQPRINLCPMFFDATWQQQLATLVHELTHLVRNTADFERPPDDEELFSNPFERVDIEVVRAKNKSYYEQKRDSIPHISPKKAAISAYNFQHFCEDLLDIEYGKDLHDACRLKSLKW